VERLFGNRDFERKAKMPVRAINGRFPWLSASVGAGSEQKRQHN